MKRAPRKLTRRAAWLAVAEQIDGDYNNRFVCIELYRLYTDRRIISNLYIALCADVRAYISGVGRTFNIELLKMNESGKSEYANSVRVLFCLMMREAN